MKIGAIIPCRTGSKGVPDKNFRMMCGKPLVKWTTEAAMESGIFDKVIVSSDGGLRKWSLVDDKVTDPKQLKKYTGVLYYDDDRPAEYSTDDAQLDPLILHYAKMYDIDMWCLLQPTSPLRTAEDIRKAFKKAEYKKYDGLVSVTQNPGMFWIRGAISSGNIATYPIKPRPNRQQRKGWFMENGAIYFVKNYVIWHTQCRCAGSVALYEMPKERSVEIDDEFDWRLCEWLLSKREGI
jgi:CMP-N,N'-diacetyllegionaminic acid synthase